MKIAAVYLMVILIACASLAACSAPTAAPTQEIEKPTLVFIEFYSPF